MMAMSKHGERVARLDWQALEAELDVEGYVVLEDFLSEAEVRDLRAAPGLPAELDALREAFYSRLAPIANRWNRSLDVVYRFPDSLDAFLRQNRKTGQQQPQSSLTCLRYDDYQALHRRSDGELVFPLQLVGLLSEPGKEFTGGEFVMTEQRPRMQSRPMVLPLRQGDMAIITVAQRPFKGSKGFYRVNLKHAIGRVRSGERYGLELLFHDARHA
jgi:hypothetical protein